METPKSSGKRIRAKKYAPTPKMSDRKKALFTTSSDQHKRTPTITTLSEIDDEDLGIMSPLQFSSSPTKYEDRESSPTTFEGALSSTSIDSGRKSVRKLFQDRYSDSTKYEFIPRSSKSLPEIEEELVDDHPLTPAQNIDWSNTWVDMSEIRDLSAPIVLLTPSETIQKQPKVSFRKSVIDKNAGNTPQVEDHTSKRRRSIDDEKEPKARTSLSFTETSISTKKFYSSTTDTIVEPKINRISNISPLANIRKHKSAPIKSNTSHHKTNQSTGRRNNASRNGINRGVFHKIHKAKPKPKKKLDIKTMSRSKLLETAMQIIDKSPLNAVLEQKQDAEEQRKKHNRMQELLKNMKNPIQMARPLNIEAHHQENEDVINAVPILETIMARSPLKSSENIKIRKFFKSKTEKKAKFQVLDGVSGVLDQGKISINKPKSKKRKLRSLFDDDFDYEEEQQEVSALLKTLDTSQNIGPTTERSQRNISPSVQISTLTSKFAQLNPVADESAMEVDVVQRNGDKQLFPVFCQEKVMVEGTSEPIPKRQKVNEWRPISDDQLQIDAGQKEFGITECKTCGFNYTQHVPEDEILHKQFHQSFQILNFKGWEKENRVLTAMEYGVNGRIIAVTYRDQKPKLTRVQEILKLVDIELGFPAVPLHSRCIIYLACNDKEIMGICVAQPLQEANKLISDFGIDFCSLESYPVKCGISRVWVSGKYRRKGVGRKLLEAVKCNFIYGYRLSNYEIAYSAPTEMGKSFAAAITGKKDFYVYQ